MRGGVGGGKQLAGRVKRLGQQLSLINAAINLDYQLDHGAGDVAAVLNRARRR